MIAQKLAQFTRAPGDLSPALGMMRLSLMDWAACGLAGRDEPVAKIVRQLVQSEGDGRATLIGGGHAATRGAALVNGTTSHALDYDDTHFDHIGHPSVAVIPAALAIAETNGATGQDLIEACLIGAEASIRFGTWLGRDHYQIGFHQTATAGAVGATCAAARLLGLTQNQMTHALGLVATRASGLKSQFGSMGKPFNAGIAASNGVEAALLAGSGFVSNPEALDGPQGFGPTHSGQAQAQAFDGLGETWRFLEISHKFHACCHGLHAMLEACQKLARRDANIERVEITTHPRWLSVCNIAAPATGLEAKFSYRFTAAMALSEIDTGAMSSFTDDITRRPDLVALCDKVEVQADPNLPETAARIVVYAASGRFQAEHDLNTPIAFDLRAEKLRTKAKLLLGNGRANTLWQATQTDNLESLVTLLRD